jgi:hypothetical protein
VSVAQRGSQRFSKVADNETEVRKWLFLPGSNTTCFTFYIYPFVPHLLTLPHNKSNKLRAGSCNNSVNIYLRGNRIEYWPEHGYSEDVPAFALNYVY